MAHYRITSEQIVGFTAEAKKAGENVKIIQKQSLTSDDSLFYVLIDQITNIFLAKAAVSPGQIRKFLIILHNNNQADIYTDDFGETQSIEINRKIGKGKKVMRSDVKQIVDVQFPDIQILDSDAIIYCSKVHWKHVLYFDFRRKINLPETQREMGSLVNDLFFQSPKTPNKYFIDNHNHKIIFNNTMQVIVEGKWDVEFIKTATQIFDNYTNLKFDVVELQGKDALMTDFINSSKINHSSSKKIYIFDCDAVKEFKKCQGLQTGYLIPFIWKKNPNNKLQYVQSGIENLFDERYFKHKNGQKNKRFIKIVYEEGVRDRKILDTKFDDECKKEFCNFICGEKKEKDVFYNFVPLFQLIEKHCT